MNRYKIAVIQGGELASIFFAFLTMEKIIFVN